MGQLALPERYNQLEAVENPMTNWDAVKFAIRPDCRDERSIEKAKTAIMSGLNDAAINYFWNLTVYDLQKKIITYGVDYFSSAINWDGKRLKVIEDLREIKDYQLISGAFALGIIPEEAHFFLQQCREIRNHFSIAHFPIGEIDKFETFNFIKNCIKYVLTYDLPAPGLQIKDLIENLSVERLDDIEKLKLIVENQSSKIHGPILHNLFANFIKNDCDPNLKHNIKLLAPYLWKIVSDEVRSSIACKFASLRDVKGKDEASEALAFLKIVDGVAYIPESFKEIIFRKHAQLLIEAHFGWNNFYTEPGFASDLASLGNEVPLSAVYIYVKAVLLSYVGNPYGVASAAQPYNIKMISQLTQTGVTTIFSLLESDIDVLRELSNYSPSERLKELMQLIKDKTLMAKQRDSFSFIERSTARSLKGHFEALYWKIARK